jgi:hypothetical protein
LQIAEYAQSLLSRTLQKQGIHIKLSPIFNREFHKTQIGSSQGPV